MKFLTRVLLVLSILVSFGQQVFSQSNNKATITGTVVDEAGLEVIGATIAVKNESTGFYTGSVTNENGVYLIKQLPLGSPYTITVTYIGYGEQKKTGYVLNQGDMLRVNFTMQEASLEIAAVEVVANSLKNTVGTTGAATSITAKDITRLPVNGRNFTSLTDLSPLANGSSIAGQLASSTAYSIDGMTSKGVTSGGTASRRAAYAISMEAIREFKVVTNQYDVTNGRAGGGSISTVTKSGTNQLKGSAFTYTRADWLSSPYDIRGNERTSEFSTYQYGFSLGGPIIKDRAHFFVAWDHQADSRPFYIVDLQTPEDESLYNMSFETRDRFLDIARNQYGVSDDQQFGSFTRNRSTDAALARIDWQLNATNLLTIRDNFVTDTNGNSIGDNVTGIFEVYSDAFALDNSLLATLRSVLSPKVTNELKFQHLYTVEEATPNEQLPEANIPRAIVERIESTVNDKSVYTSLQLGGQRYTPENFYNNVLQLVDNVYYSNNNVDYTFGADIMYTNLNSRYGSEINGRFFFNGLDAFENMTPYRYVREVYNDPDQRVTQNILNAGAYAQLQTKLFKGFDVMAGLRLDNATYFDKGTFNQVVFDELGLRTDNDFSTFHIQPRAQITWDINEKGKDIIRLGGGIFASDLNNYAMINNMVFDGTKVTTIDVQGDLVPTPDFESYRNDPSTAPGLDLLQNPTIKNNSVPTINMNAAGAKVPVAYKGNVSYTHFFNDRLKMSATGYMTLTRNNYMYVDRNMVEDPYFRIASEGNRGVYVPAATISTAGTCDWQDSRATDKVGRVMELGSEGRVNQFAFVVDGTWRYYKDGEISLSYTWNDSKDNCTYSGDVANTATLVQMVADDPRDLSKMSYSNNQFRHKVVAYGSLPTFYGVNVGARFSGTGGSRFSLCVNGNINGDFVSTNDLAYIYDINDPATPDNIREGLQAILDNPDAEESLKEYIRESSGKIAERNGGENGFYGVLDLRISKNFKIYKTQGLELSVDMFNVANMLNKEWGTGHNMGNQYIYTVTGFDHATNTYTYNVNTNAGNKICTGTPFQVQIGLRYAF